MLQTLHIFYSPVHTTQENFENAIIVSVHTRRQINAFCFRQQFPLLFQKYVAFFQFKLFLSRTRYISSNVLKKLFVIAYKRYIFPQFLNICGASEIELQLVIAPIKSEKSAVRICHALRALASNWRTTQRANAFASWWPF